MPDPNDGMQRVRRGDAPASGLAKPCGRRKDRLTLRRRSTKSPRDDEKR